MHGGPVSGLYLEATQSVSAKVAAMESWQVWQRVRFMGDLRIATPWGLRWVVDSKQFIDNNSLYRRRLTVSGCSPASWRDLAVRSGYLCASSDAHGDPRYVETT